MGRGGVPEGLSTEVQLSSALLGMLPEYRNEYFIDLFSRSLGASEGCVSRSLCFLSLFPGYRLCKHASAHIPL